MPRIILSASRRTDIPAFYMPWFMACLERGFFEAVNPYNQAVSRIEAGVDDLHSIVFWSKDFHSFLDSGHDRKLVQRGYRLFFNFTINSPHPLLEPHVPPLAKRLDQLARLCERFDPQCIQWRFDPVCFFLDRQGRSQDNLDAFGAIADRAAALGVRTCITSFVDLYRKVLRRLQATPDVRLYDPPLERKVACILNLERRLAAGGLRLGLCCEKEVLAALPQTTTVRSAACVPGRRLIQLYGPGISLRKDPGQRASAGCGCTASRDIGNYGLHPCPHDCLFCYANPSSDACDTLSPKSPCMPIP